MGCRALSVEDLFAVKYQHPCLDIAEIYIDLLRIRESPIVCTSIMVPATAASPESKKRTRAHDDVVILTEKRVRKGLGFYTHFADSTPTEQEVAGESFAQSLDHICI